MTSQPLVSIIVPVYNSAPYLDQCLECLSRQTYQHMEIILIDDGSSDESLSILQRECRRYHPLFKLYTQENKGTGATRNRGIGLASGKYLMFADNDDRMESDYVRKMVYLIEKHQADMVVGGCRRVSEDGQVIFEHVLGFDAWSKFRTVAPWSRIMRRDFIIENQIEFGDFQVGEDSYFSITAYNLSRKTVTTRYIGYEWVDHQTSVSNTVQKQGVSSALPMLKGLMKKNPQCLHISQAYFNYFIIKYIVWHLTYIAKHVSLKTLDKFTVTYFAWLKTAIPSYEKNPYVKINKPNGETKGIRFTVWLITRLPMPLKKIVLRIYRLLP